MFLANKTNKNNVIKIFIIIVLILLGVNYFFVKKASFVKNQANFKEINFLDKNKFTQFLVESDIKIDISQFQMICLLDLIDIECPICQDNFSRFIETVKQNNFTNEIVFLIKNEELGKSLIQPRVRSIKKHYLNGFKTYETKDFKYSFKLDKSCLIRINKELAVTYFPINIDEVMNGLKQLRK